MTIYVSARADFIRPGPVWSGTLGRHIKEEEWGVHSAAGYLEFWLAEVERHMVLTGYNPHEKIEVRAVGLFDNFDWHREWAVTLDSDINDEEGTGFRIHMPCLPMDLPTGGTAWCGVASVLEYICKYGYTDPSCVFRYQFHVDVFNPETYPAQELRLTAYEHRRNYVRTHMEHTYWNLTERRAS